MCNLLSQCVSRVCAYINTVYMCVLLGIFVSIVASKPVGCKTVIVVTQLLITIKYYVVL